MRTLVILALASIAIAACSFHSETVEHKAAPDAPPGVVTSNTTVGVGTGR
jgi:hypothetical protein